MDSLYTSAISKSGRWSLLLLFYVVSFTSVTGQDIEMGDIEIQGDKVVVNYALKDDQVDRRYTLWLYSSQDDFTVPLKQVTGDIGVNLPIGGNKQVIWNAAEELGAEFKGELSLSIKGQLYVPFVELTGFDYTKFKKGKAYDITWTGGRGDNVLNLELYRKDERMHVFPNIANVGQYEMVIPKTVKPGKDYTLKITDARNQDDVVVSKSFVIKRKTPAFLKFFGVAVIGVAAYLAYDMLSNPPDNSIPLPPDPQ